MWTHRFISHRCWSADFIGYRHRSIGRGRRQDGFRFAKLSLALMIAVGLAVADALALDEPALDALQPLQTWSIEAPTHHVQGLEVDPQFAWITSVERSASTGWILRIDRKTFKPAARRRLSMGRQNHPGGCQIVGDVLWVPLAEYRPNSSTTVVGVDRLTLEPKSSFTVDDHLGALAADDKRFIGMNWDARKWYSFDPAGKLLKRDDNPTGVPYQDVKLFENRLYAAGPLRREGRTAGVVDVFDLEPIRHLHRYRLEGTPRTKDKGFADEGFALDKGSFYLLPEDGPFTTLYRFPVPDGSERSQH